MSGAGARDPSYREQAAKLAVRIRAHKEFANLDLADWLGEHLAARPRRHLLDLGCGDGNHLGLYLERVGPGGTVSGLDREPALIATARERYSAAPNLELVVGSMDDPLPFPGGRFDTVCSMFAIYNARDLGGLLAEVTRVMASGGELILVGPTAANARELYEYNERLTGTPIDETTALRTDRLRREVLPAVRSAFRDVRTVTIESFLTFPSREEFVRYFRATLLYERIAERRALADEELLAACAGERPRLSKEMLAVIATR